MKKRLFIPLLILSVILCAAAAADPAVTDGQTTGWIAENNYLCLQSPNGSVAQLPIAMDEILRITDDELICLARDQRIIAVRNDGSGSRVIDSTEAATLGVPRLTLEDGNLTMDGRQLSSSVCAAATDGLYLYTVDKIDQTFVLRVNPVQESGKLIAPGSRDANAMALSNKPVTEALSLTVTKETLTLTATDRQVTVMNLITGETLRYPAVSSVTEAACMINGMLYRYLPSDDGHWIFESGTPLATPTPVPTQTPTPTPRTTQAPTPTPRQSGDDSDDDGTIYYGASGSTVRKIQARLKDLDYPVGDVDGAYGEDTQLAINLFCDAIHVREHNYITPKVQKRLFARNAPEYDPYLPLKKGDQGVSVWYMQRQLKIIGYDPGVVDGAYGKNTVKAVAAFQKDNKIKRKKHEKPGEVASREMLMILFGEGPWPVYTDDPPVFITPTPPPSSSPATQTDLKP